MKDGEVNYPLWTICLQGAAWGNRSMSEAKTIEEVEQTLARHKAGDYGDPAKPRDYSWLLYSRHEWDEQGKDIGWQPVPVRVEVWRGMNINFRGALVARWVGGERVL